MLCDELDSAAGAGGDDTSKSTADAMNIRGMETANNIEDTTRTKEIERKMSLKQSTNGSKTDLHVNSLTGAKETKLRVEDRFGDYKEAHLRSKTDPKYLHEEEVYLVRICLLRCGRNFSFRLGCFSIA